MPKFAIPSNRINLYYLLPGDTICISAARIAEKFSRNNNSEEAFAAQFDGSAEGLSPFEKIQRLAWSRTNAPRSGDTCRLVFMQLLQASKRR